MRTVSASTTCSTTSTTCWTSIRKGKTPNRISRTSWTSTASSSRRTRRMVKSCWTRWPSATRPLYRLDAHLQAARPGEDWEGSSQFSGDNPLGMGEGAQALADIGELEQLAEQLSQAYPGATMDDVDLDALARHFADQAHIDARTLSELERALVNQGFLDRSSDGQWRLSPKAMRRLGETALRDVAQQLSSRHGERDLRRGGAAGGVSGGPLPRQVRG